jgi:hypothetical protein
VDIRKAFPTTFWRREYRKINAISENKNENIEIIVKDGNVIRKEILENYIG